MTKRLITALENKYLDIIAHPTGRLINRRDPYVFDYNKVFAAAAENGKCLEISSSPERLDLNYQLVRAAKKYNVKFTVDTDSHSPEQLNFMKFGVAMARKGWCTKEDIVNTLSFKELGKVFKKL